MSERIVRPLCFDDDYDSKRKKKKSRNQERRVAEMLGGSRVPLSGANERMKGDISSADLLIEAKYTAKESLSIKREWLEKIAMEAMAVGKTPALSFSFDQSSAIVPKDWIAVPASFLSGLLGERDG